MTFEEPHKARYELRQELNNLVIAIPAKRNWFMILFLGFWLLGWAMGEVSVLGTLLAGASKAATSGIGEASNHPAGAFGGLFLLAWLGAWTVGGAFAIYAWLWQVKGIEEITFSAEAVTIANKIPMWNRQKNYRIENVKGLRVSNVPINFMDPARSMDFWGVTGGVLSFDYGSGTIRFGKGLEAAEAREIVSILRQRYPNVVAGGA
jgi:hypothetical protein